MVQTAIHAVIAALIVLPLVAIVVLGIQRVGRFEWSGQSAAVGSMAITVVLVAAYLLLT